MSVVIDLQSPISGSGDTAAAIVYRLVDSMGSPWWSSPMVQAGALWMTSIPGGGTSGSAKPQFLRIPTLRHLMPGTTAQIELYIGQTDLELFKVFPNDTTVDYIDYSPELEYMDKAGTVIGMSLAQAIEARRLEGPMPVIYTNGNALANDPPPVSRCLTIWRNRCICCEGNNIRVSQEFADGIGIQWNNVTRVTWNEGTGDILAVCAIDWNYLAVFKTDAIGVISGPGPDGVGHGNYIVQTLLTKMGCNNPKSVVNGADGCYFQDSATLRLGIVTAQLQVAELAPGWFNAEQASITCAMQVEPRRQVWAATNDGQIIVLDYKHKTDRCPFGQAFTWKLPAAFGNVVGMCMVGSSPRLVFDGGRLGSYVESAAVDTGSNGVAVPIAMSWETGELQPFSLQGMSDVSVVQMLGEYVSPHTIQLTIYPDFAASGTTVSKSMTAGPEQVATRPPGCQRVQAIRVRGAVVPGVTAGKALKFIGFAMEVQPRGRLKRLDVGGFI